MIKNANLYELINMSLRSSGLQHETVEGFIQRALDKKHTSDLIQIKENTKEDNLSFEKPRINRELGINSHD